MEEELIHNSEKENIQFIINNLFEETDLSVSETIKHEDNKISNDLDTTWITEHERLSSIHENYLREPMESIHVYYIYINRNHYIEKIINDVLELTIERNKQNSYLSKENLLQIIQTKKLKTPFSKYKLIDVVSFVVDLEPENIQSYSNQHYPPGTQKNYNSFSSRNLIIGKGKELEFPEGQGGGKGEPGVPPIRTHVLGSP